MARRFYLLALMVALSACSGGGEPPSPEEVVRAWSRALNAGDNEAAAELFAPGARIEQGGIVIVVRHRADAAAWNRSLPCSGKIVGLATEGSTATATFELFDRRTSRCDAPGARVTAAFTVGNGKILRFRQLGGQPAPVESV